MKIAYISGPYRADDIEGIQDNIYRARKVAVELWRMGYAVITPHLNTANFPGEVGDNPSRHNIDYIRGDLEIIFRLDRCKGDCVVMLPGWENSIGAKKEKQVAEISLLDIFFWPEDKELLINHIKD